MLDKTGTVTTGHMELTDVEMAPGVARAEVLRLAGALEQASEHLVARAVALAALEELGDLPPVTRVCSLARPWCPRDGSRATSFRSAGQSCSARRARGGDGLATRCAALEALGRTTVLVGCDGAVVGAIAVADTVRPSAPSAVRQLQLLGLDCILVTGDNEPTARARRGRHRHNEVVAGALPTDKVAFIRQLQASRSVGRHGRRRRERRSCARDGAAWPRHRVGHGRSDQRRRPDRGT